MFDALLQLIGHPDARGTLRQRLRHSLTFEEIAIHDELLLASHRLADGFRVNVGIAVHIPAHPRPESQDLRHLHCTAFGAVRFLERSADLLVKDGHDLEQDLDDEKEHVLALVGHGQPLA